MKLSREAKLVSGVTLLAVPTIMYGGITLLGILTRGIAGLAPGELVLDETQWALWRAEMIEHIEMGIKDRQIVGVSTYQKL
jgi:hypothetical protein